MLSPCEITTNRNVILGWFKSTLSCMDLNEKFVWCVGAESLGTLSCGYNELIPLKWIRATRHIQRVELKKKKGGVWFPCHKNNSEDITSVSFSFVERIKTIFLLFCLKCNWLIRLFFYLYGLCSFSLTSRFFFSIWRIALILHFD